MKSERKTQSQSLDQSSKIYEDVQVIRIPETAVRHEDLRPLSENWKEQTIPELQRRVVDAELEDLRQGVVTPVYASLTDTLKHIPLSEFTLLDAACASGYYSEVIRTLDKRKIQYIGSDYSPAMVEAARRHYPDRRFEVQNLTALSYSDRSVDVLLASGVLEHIPDYDKAIEEICRVAGRYVILHRLPFTDQQKNECTLGSQYSIKTPRIYFCRKWLLAEMAKHHFTRIHEQDTYPSSGHKNLWRSRLKILLGLESKGRQTKTLLFSRK